MKIYKKKPIQKRIGFNAYTNCLICRKNYIEAKTSATFFPISAGDSTT